MSYVQRHVVSVTTAADGSATAYSPVVTGKISHIVYVPDGSNAYANTVDMTITAEATGEAILTKTNVAAGFTNAPRQATHDTAGAASLYAAAGEPVEAPICLANDRVKIVLAQGGASKVGVFHIVLD